MIPLKCNGADLNVFDRRIKEHERTALARLSMPDRCAYSCQREKFAVKHCLQSASRAVSIRF
jgi:hypothetical protein